MGPEWGYSEKRARVLIRPRAQRRGVCRMWRVSCAVSVANAFPALLHCNPGTSELYGAAFGDGDLSCPLYSIRLGVKMRVREWMGGQAEESQRRPCKWASAVLLRSIIVSASFLVTFPPKAGPPRSQSNQNPGAGLDRHATLFSHCLAALTALVLTVLTVPLPTGCRLALISPSSIVRFQ